MDSSTIPLLQTSLQGSLSFENNVPTIHNPHILQEKDIDTLVFSSVFAKQDEVKEFARSCIRAIAPQLGVRSSSIFTFYQAIGEGHIRDIFTVPAFNIRALTYDTARLLFRLSKELSLGPFIFEIARSEIDYTDQSPDEYAVVISAAAIKEGYTGPLFLQGDHYQLSARRFQEDPDKEITKIKELIDISLAAGFCNIDIDASTLVDLEKTDLTEQQRNNYEVTAILTKYIREKESRDSTISIGAEIGHIGGKNSTREDLIAFMNGYSPLVNDLKGISKISVQTGTSHGGVPLPDGSMAKVAIDFKVLEMTGKSAREVYHLGGVVQHGASTLPNDLFDQFPLHKTLEIHLATGFQNIVYDTIPSSLKEEMYSWIETTLQKEWEEGWTKEQFIYKTRKKALGPFKKSLWELDVEGKEPILSSLEQQFRLLFDKLGIVDKAHLLASYA